MANLPHTQRLFLGIELPESVKDQLAKIQTNAEHWRWTAPENLHLTLHFLGEQDVEMIRLALDDCTADVHPFELRLNGVGTFQHAGRDTILWVGVESSPSLSKLHSELADMLRDLGIAVDERPFHPHITLARGPASAKLVWSDSVEAERNSDISLTVANFALFRSNFGRGPVSYEVHQRVALT